MNHEVHIVGAGLAGSECAFQLAERGIPVYLYEMRPDVPTGVHKTGLFAELVCSNSFRSDDPFHPSGILKRELEKGESLILRVARKTRVPAGKALAVDRHAFASAVTEALSNHPNIHIIRREVTELPDGIVVLATGPLTSPALLERVRSLLSPFLYFYDALAPIVAGESLDWDKLFWASRYREEEKDYLNAPLTEEEYRCFYEALLSAEAVPLPPHEKHLFFEGCLPLEEMARRGFLTLAYGPMKPVGLTDPRTGQQPFAVVQLRPENLDRTAFNLVGFQTRLKWGEQEKVLRLIPGLEKVKVLRYGQVHRNTFINAPALLSWDFSLQNKDNLYVIGQLTGVEGYLESAATGWLCGVFLAHRLLGIPPTPPPSFSAMGGLIRHLTQGDPNNFQPSNITFSLMEGARKRHKERVAQKALEGFDRWFSTHASTIEKR